MTKNIKTVLPLFICAALLIGCGMKESPEKVVESTFNALSMGDYEQATEHLAEINYLTLYMQSDGDFNSVIWKTFWKNLTGTDDYGSIKIEEIRKCKAWSKVYSTITSYDGNETEAEWLLIKNGKDWQIIMGVEVDIPALNRKQ
ncbi:MAG: DUF4878 domain-containing protein [Lentisphaerae bacterium]|nr:DUF4878 domain-containing protein [Lentisphaerota bacterium]